MIRSKKINLSAIKRGDLEQMREWRNDPNLRQYFREHAELTPDDQEIWYNNYVLNRKEHLLFGIHLNDKVDTLIGFAGLEYIDWITRSAEFGIYIPNDLTYRNKGYGKEALLTLCRYGFDEVNLHKIWCEVFDNNEALKFYQSAGFAKDGVLRDNYYKDGKYGDSIIMSMLRHEFKDKELM